MRRLCGFLIASAVAAAPVALADDIVHFTNGAEMTVRSHALEKDMVRLDLGGSSSITFPVSMVDKIVSSGKNVFLNPVYHPSNQAVAPVDVPEPLPDRGVRGGGPSVGYRLGQSKSGTGLRMGEASNDPGDGYEYGGTGRVTTVQDERHSKFSTPKPRRFDATRPQPIGVPQTIEPPSGTPTGRAPAQIQLKVGSTSVTPPPAEPSESDTQAPPPPADQEAPPQDPPESD